MIIQELIIKGFKSIGNIKLSQPNAFSVFVGPNAAGKSNIFEALEFWWLSGLMKSDLEVLKLYGNEVDVFNRKLQERHSEVEILVQIKSPGLTDQVEITWENMGSSWPGSGLFFHTPRLNDESKSLKAGELRNFTRLFVNNAKLLKRPTKDDSRLTLDASNLEKVLKRILQNEKIREEIFELLQLLIPGFDKVEIISEELSGSDSLLIYENDLIRPLNKSLISDGTFNLLAIIAALYHSDEPQFLCIEEPENGINPKVIKELVKLFRIKCQEGHFIWLNTHSQTLVSELQPHEIILVDKKDGLTETKQLNGINLHGLSMDEALLTNVLGGGIPW